MHSGAARRVTLLRISRMERRAPPRRRITVDGTATARVDCVFSGRVRVAEVQRRRCPCGALAPLPRARVELPAHGLAPPELATCSACHRVLVVADANVGRVFLGKWKVLRRLGQGGMGTVYLAEDLSVGREVALKFLDGTLAQRQEYHSRFAREAKVMAQVEHANVASLYGVEQDGDAPFLVMRYVRGAPLSEVMLGGARSLDEVLPVVAQLVSGLKALHSRGFVHRDLKPGNVMLDDEGRVTLLDFGLTRGSESALTRPGITLGSPHYMSPEQVMGGAVDPRTDVYALGLLTSELLVGHRPYPLATGADAMQAHLFAEPERADVGNPAVPRAVADVLLVALAKKTGERFASVQAFFEALLQAARPGVAAPRGDDQTAVARLAQSVPHLPEVAEVISSDTLSGLTPESTPRPSGSTSSTERDLPPTPERSGRAESSKRPDGLRAGLAPKASLGPVPQRSLTPLDQRETVVGAPTSLEVSALPPREATVVHSQDELKTPALAVRPGGAREAQQRPTVLVRRRPTLALAVVSLALLAALLAWRWV